MTSVAIAKNYARALYRLSHEKDVSEKVFSGLKFLEKHLLQEPRLKDILQHPLIEEKDKKGILQDILKSKEEKVPAELLHFLYIVIDKKREDILQETIELFRRYYQEARNIQVVEVTSPSELKEEQRSKIAENMEKYLGHKVVLEEKVDPSMKGGIILKAGTLMLDGSLETRLKKLEDQLLQREESSNKG